jgi:hypothetical protein
VAYNTVNSSVSSGAREETGIACFSRACNVTVRLESVAQSDLNAHTKSIRNDFTLERLTFRLLT